MKENALKSSFTPSNSNKRTVTAFDELNQYFAQVSESNRDDLICNNLQFEQFSKPTPTQVNILKIFSPPGFTRHNSEPFDDFEILDKPDLIKVVKAKGINGYFVVDGQRRLEFYKRSIKTNKINVLVLGKVVCQSQIAMARAKTMTMLKRPPNTMELIQGIISLYEIILTDFGKDAFYYHGGNRKNEKKQSLSQYIANVLKLPKSTVNALLNFGNYIGPYGLSGLHYHKDMQTLSIRKINQINARLKKEDLSQKTYEMASEIRKTKATESEIIKTCGNLAHNIITDCITDLDGQNTSTNEDDSDTEEFEESEFDLSDYDLPPKQKKSSKNQNSESDSDNDDEDENDNLKDEIKDSLKLLKKFKHLLPNFEKLLQTFDPSEITTQGKLIKNLIEFNDNGEDFISLITKLMTDIKIGN